MPSFTFYSSYHNPKLFFIVCLTYQIVRFPGCAVVKNPPANAGDLGSIPGLGRSPGGGHGNPLLEEGMATHSSILACRIPMDRGAWGATVHGLAKSQT